MSALFRIMAVLCVLMWGAAPAHAEDEAPTLAEIVGSPALGEAMPEELARVEGARIGKGLRCPVCQGLSISDSPSEAARAALQRIQDLLMAGYTEEQVEDYFVDRYGEWALLEPRAKGLNWIIWLAPILGVLLGLWMVRGRLGDETGPAIKSAEAGEPDEAPVDDVDPYAQQVLDTLKERRR